MTMHTKITVYAVLAIALGYLLVSIVPGGLIPKGEEVLYADEGARLPQKDKQAAGIEDFEAPKTTKRGFWYEASQFSVWIINLMIALGVYFVARRRFT